MNLGPAEIAVIFVVALIALGPQRLPEAARQVARGMAQLKQFQASIRDEVSGMTRIEPAVADVRPHVARAEIPPEPDGGSFS